MLDDANLWRRDGDAPYYRKAVCVVHVITGPGIVETRVFDTHVTGNVMVRIDDLDNRGIIGSLCNRCGAIVVEP